MAIIPGGTANVMANELGIPVDLMEACALCVNPDAVIRAVDMGRTGNHYFLLRVGMGLEAAMVKGADRDLKDRLGVLAYTFSALQALADPQVARYHITADGKQIESEGLTCIIANSGALGLPGMNLAPGINISDGLLDVIVVRSVDLPSLITLAASVVGGNERTEALQHWQGREITVVADPIQTIQVDGEILGNTPIKARVVPQAIQVIVPPQALKGAG